MKKMVWIAAGAALCLAVTENAGPMVWGGRAPWLGLLASLLCIGALLGLPFLCRDSKRFLKAWQAVTGVLTVVAVVGLLKGNDVIASDAVVPLVALLTPFYGLTYAVPDAWFYPMFIVVSLVCCALCAFFIIRKESKEDTL